MTNRLLESRTTYFVVANMLVLAVLAYAWFLEVRLPDFYYMSVQEDEYIEWASFWAFLLAAVAAVVAAEVDIHVRRELTFRALVPQAFKVSFSFAHNSEEVLLHFPSTLKLRIGHLALDFGVPADRAQSQAQQSY